MPKIKQLIPKKICLECLGCCRFASRETVWSVHLLRGENKKLSGKDCRLPLLENPAQGNFTCKFLNTRHNKCRVYAQRPLECQLYPFLINHRGREVFLSLDLKCPFARDNFKSQNLKDSSLDIIRLLTSPKYRAILKENPQVIQEYGEVEDIAKLKF